MLLEPLYSRDRGLRESRLSVGVEVGSARDWVNKSR